MRAALILDHERLTQEQPMFNRLCVGLLAEGVHPVRVVPSSFDRAHEDAEERRVALLPRISYAPQVLPWLRRGRAGRLVEELDRLGVRVVHAAGETAWSMAIAVARDLERPLVLGVWSLAEADAARRHRRAGVGAWLAPCERIVARLRRVVEPTLVHVVPAGVPVTAIPPEPPCAAEGECRFLVGLGDGLDLRAWERFLPAVRRLVDQPTFAEVQLVLEVRGPRGHDIWRRVRDLDLLDRVCSLTDAAEHRRLLLRGHGLCLPEPMVGLRTLVLEAMAQGIPVAAVDTPVLDEMGGDGGDAIAKVDSPTTDLWAATLQQILEDRVASHRLCRNAWQRVHERHRSTQQAAGVAALYRSLVHGDALPFDPARTAGDGRP